MSSREKARRVSGWVLLDKPEGMSSTRAVGEVKRLLGARKAGHAGTLDPLATGMLPIALGEATKTVPFVQGGRKLYRFTASWGAETETGDREGAVTETSTARPSREEIEAILDRFQGEILQVPPAYSAIKIAGQRAYRRAREGEAVSLQARPVLIHRLALVGAGPDEATFEVTCGKGTYVRALAQDIGRALGTRAHVSSLRRLAVHPFRAEDMISLDALRSLRDKAGRAPASADAAIRPVEAALDDIPALALTTSQAMRVRQGQPVIVRGDRVVPSGTAYATSSGSLLALGDVEAGAFRPKRVFSL